MDDQVQSVTSSGTPALARSLTLWHATLYGLGVTIGAGIYVLIGAAAARAGMQAPLAFVAAASLMALSGASFAELACTRREFAVRVDEDQCSMGHGA